MKKVIIATIVIICNLSCSGPETQSQKNENDIPEIPEEIKEFSMSQIMSIHQYINIDRWNNGGDIGMRHGTSYNEIADKLKLPTSKLKSIDSYYHYEVLPILDKEIKNKFKNHKNFRPDYYLSVEPTAYCGINTLRGSIVVFGQKASTDFKKEAENIAISLIGEIPEWITGYKLNYVTYEDHVLETKGLVDIGFLWIRKDNQMYKMKSSQGLYGYERPEANGHWHNQEWNDGRKIIYPEIR